MMFKIILLILFPICCFAKYHLSICAIFRDEAEFLQEWIDFHRIQKVEHFYLYNNLSIDNYDEVLEPYIKAGIVTLTEWPFESYDVHEWYKIQDAAYMDCIQKNVRRSEWIAVIDTDEFLFSPKGVPLPKVLNEYKDFGAVCANWHMFGTSEVEMIPQNKLMINLLTHCAPKDYIAHKTFKSIVQPKYVLNICNPHRFVLSNEKYTVDENKNRVDANETGEQSIEKLRINHYWTRTEEFYRTRKIDRQKKLRSGNIDGLLKAKETLNQCTDECILQYSKKLENLQKAERHAYPRKQKNP